MSNSVTKRPVSGVSRSPLRSMFSHGLFDDMLDRYFNDSNGELSEMMNVSMDVVETEQVFEVKIDLPGINPDDVSIQIDNNTLTIRGQRNEESEESDAEKQFHRLERYRGSFARSVVLPNSINEDETAAEFKDGVLKIVIPKSEEAKPKKITISK